MYVYVQVISEFSIGHKKNSIHYPVKQFLVQFWRQQEKKTHGQIDWLIDCYYNSRQLGLLQITTTCHYTLRSLGYYNSRQLLLQFTTSITIHDRTVVTRDDSQWRFLAQHSVAILEY